MNTQRNATSTQMCTIKWKKNNVQERVNERKEQRNEIDREGDRGVRIPDSLAPY